MPASAIVGWIMFALGVALIVLELVAQGRALFGPAAQGGPEVATRGLNETAAAVAKLLEAFNKFSERMQRLLLGAGLMIGGIYLLSTQPF